MSSPCEDLRLRLCFEASHPRPWSAEVEQHVATCEDCAARAARVGTVAAALMGLARQGVPGELVDRVSFAFEPLARGVRAGQFIAALPRAEVPSELTGWVVAAQQAGSREDRAVREVAGVAPLRAPAILDRLVADQVPHRGALKGRRSAPADLEKRVAEELIRLPRAQVRRAASRTGRRQTVGNEALERGRRATTVLLLGMATAFTVLLLTFGFGPDSARGVRAAGDALGPIAQPWSPSEDLPSVVHGMADGLSGGLWSVQRSLDASGAGDAAAPERSAPAPAPAGGSGSRTPIGEGASAAPGTRTAPRHRPQDPAPHATGGFLQRIASSSQTLAFRGVRRVELFSEGSSTPSLVYLEEAFSDAQGNFAVDPIEVLEPVGGAFDAELFLGLQKAREGFVHRYRDFRVRGEESFLVNYEVLSLGAGAAVAQRPCIELDVRRITGLGSRYRVLVDQETALVLGYEEFDSEGSPVARVQYETLELDPDLTGVPLGGGPTIFVPIDPTDADQHPFPLTMPVAVPLGFELTEIAAADVDNEPWVRFRYGDGVEQVFLLIGSPPAAAAAVAPAKNAPQDRLWYFRVGAWSVVQGEVGGRQVAAFGKLHRMQLELLLQSAL